MPTGSFNRLEGLSACKLKLKQVAGIWHANVVRFPPLVSEPAVEVLQSHTKALNHGIVLCWGRGFGPWPSFHSCKIYTWGASSISLLQFLNQPTHNVAMQGERALIFCFLKEQLLGVKFICPSSPKVYHNLYIFI